MSGPAARVTEITATSFSVTITALSNVSGLYGSTTNLDTRPLGSSGDWENQDVTYAPSQGYVLTATGLTEGVSLEWRVMDQPPEDVVHDGTHGITTPAESIWSTLTAVVKAALVGQGMAEEAIYIGRQPEPNYPDVCAVIRTLEERVTARANNVERVVYPIEVEIRVTITDDDGGRQKAELERWVERVRAALHGRTANEIVGACGLEEVTVESVTVGTQPADLSDVLLGTLVVKILRWRSR